MRGFEPYVDSQVRFYTPAARQDNLGMKQPRAICDLVPCQRSYDRESKALPGKSRQKPDPALPFGGCKQEDPDPKSPNPISATLIERRYTSQLETIANQVSKTIKATIHIKQIQYYPTRVLF